MLDPSDRDYTPISPDKIEVPTPIVVVTVQCYAGGPLRDDVEMSLKRKYGEAYQGDHFGTSDQYQSAWRAIYRVLDSGRTPASVQSVVRGLEVILQDHHRIARRKQPWGSKARRAGLFRHVLNTQPWRKWGLSFGKTPIKDSLDSPSKNLAGADVEDGAKISNTEAEPLYSDVQSIAGISPLPSTAEPNYNPIAEALAHQGSSCAAHTTSSESQTTHYGSVFLFRDLSEHTITSQTGGMRLYPASPNNQIGEKR